MLIVKTNEDIVYHGLIDSVFDKTNRINFPMATEKSTERMGHLWSADSSTD